MKQGRLSSVAQKFILHWGEMGTRWGVNRTVAQIHALLYVSPEPLNAEDIADVLSVARSNVSTSLKELQGWRLVKTARVLGDRRDHFETHSDVWELFKVVLEERKRREIDPTVAVLRECVAEAGKDAGTQERLKELLGFIETWDAWFDDVRGLSPAALRNLARLGSKVQKLVSLAG